MLACFGLCSFYFSEIVRQMYCAALHIVSRRPKQIDYNTSIQNPFQPSQRKQSTQTDTNTETHTPNTMLTALSLPIRGFRQCTQTVESVSHLYRFGCVLRKKNPNNIFNMYAVVEETTNSTSTKIVMVAYL